MTIQSVQLIIFVSIPVAAFVIFLLLVKDLLKALLISFGIIPFALINVLTISFGTTALSKSNWRYLDYISKIFQLSTSNIGKLLLISFAASTCAIIFNAIRHRSKSKYFSIAVATIDVIFWFIFSLVWLIVNYN